MLFLNLVNHLSFDMIQVDLELDVLVMFLLDHIFLILDSNINQLHMVEHKVYHHYIEQKLEH